MLVPKQVVGAPFDIPIDITSNDPIHPNITVPIHVKRTGVVLKLERAAVDFGVMPLASASPTQAIAVTNEGNEPAILMQAAPEGFLVSFTKPVLQPGESGSAVITFQPTKVASFASSLSIRADNLCGDAPAIDLKGVGSDGVVGLSPGTADLGLVDCGTQTLKTAKVTIINASKQSFDVKTSVTASTLFEAAPAQVTVPGESTADVTVSMPVVPSAAPLLKDYFTGTLHVETTAPKDNAHDLPIVASPQGGIIVLDSIPDLDFAKRDALASAATRAITVKNAGNLAVTVGGLANAPFAILPSAQLIPGGKGDVLVQHTPRFVDVGKDSSETVTVATTDPICSALPIVSVAKAHTFEKAIVATESRREHACAIGKSGHVYCWGKNDVGQIGDGTQVDRATPTLVANVTNASAVGTGVASCALAGGEVWCWGNTAYGPGITPQKVNGINDAVSVSAGNSVACARRMSGGVWCWGELNLLGNGSSGSGTSGPVAVSGLTDAIDLDTTDDLTCAVRQTSNDLVCWGFDQYQFAQGPNAQSLQKTPVQISGSNGAVETSVQGGGACWLRMDGYIGCWGLHRGMSASWSVELEDGNYTTSGLTSNTGGERCGLRNGGMFSCFGDWTSLNVYRSGTGVWLGYDRVLAIDAGTLLQWGQWGQQTINTPTPVPGFDP